MRTNVRNVVTIVIAQHLRRSACIFVANTPDRIEAEYNAMPKPIPDEVGWIANAIRACEIYCPHEGIDRRPWA